MAKMAMAFQDSLEEMQEKYDYLTSVNRLYTRVIEEGLRPLLKLLEKDKTMMLEAYKVDSMIKKLRSDWETNEQSRDIIHSEIDKMQGVDEPTP